MSRGSTLTSMVKKLSKTTRQSSLSKSTKQNQTLYRPLSFSLSSKTRQALSILALNRPKASCISSRRRRCPAPGPTTWFSSLMDGASSPVLSLMCPHRSVFYRGKPMICWQWWVTLGALQTVSTTFVKFFSYRTPRSTLSHSYWAHCSVSCPEMSMTRTIKPRRKISNRLERKSWLTSSKKEQIFACKWARKIITLITGTFRDI